MKKLLLLTVVLFAFASVASAAPIQCSTAQTLQDLITDVSCVSQGVTFTFTSGSWNNNGGSLTASQIAVSLVTAQLAGGMYQDGFSFTVKNGTFSPGTYDFVYSVAITPGNSLNIVDLVQSGDQMNVHVPSSVTTSDTQTYTGGLFVLALNGLNTGAETEQSSLYGASSVTTSSVITIPINYNLISYEQDFYSEAPEPVSFVLIGSGLMGLAFLRRRLHKS